jgi:chromosome partition protein MukB
MSRARATTLALVNWKGVFFERYLLDPQVTALEGANGAGKTTVMIAAYVVLLPDLGRLRFTNLGETAATGGDRGIYGRLGGGGRPSYAALELDLAGERVILCVQLEQKAEPSVQLTAFMVHGLSPAHGLSALLLLSDGERESVPELAELKQRAATLGARVELFDSVRDYFTALFERGIVPLRLANDDDRAKFNEMLRTSMTGGISRALTSELRTFLLKEESGLSDTLSRMRANLDACRRTRSEVQEARGLEREINGVYEAGAGMFAAALAALQAEVNEAARRCDAERALENGARFALAEAEAALADGSAREAAVRGRLTEVRALLDAEKARRERLSRAAELARRSEELRAELLPATAASDAEKLELERCAQVREAAKRDLARAREAYDGAARGLANLQSGLEDLHRRAHAFKRGHAVLEDARRLLALPDLAEDELEAALERARQQLLALDAERARRERELSTAKQRRDDFERAEAALRSMVPCPPGEELYALARSELTRLAELRPLAKELPTLRSRMDRARRDAARREETALRVAAAGIDPTNPEVGREVERLVQTLGQQLQQAEERARELAGSRREAEEQASRWSEQLAEAQAKAERWQRHRASAERLAALLGGVPASRDELRAGKERLLAEREIMRSRAYAERTRRERLLAEASRFERDGGGFEPRLLELCEELGGELFAARYEDVGADQAARLQAELGPLASAIVVDDLEAALTKLEASDASLDEVVLVRAGETIADSKGELVGGRLLAVPTETGLRVSRLPERPNLGRNARETQRITLLAEAEHLALEVERTTSELRRMDGYVSSIEELLREAELAFGPDPRVAAVELEARIDAARTLAQTHANDSLASLAQASELRKRLEATRPLLAETHRLDAVQELGVEELERAVGRAHTAELELARTQASRPVLAEWVEALRVPPPAAAELQRFERERAELDAARDRLFAGLEALGDAIETRQARGFVGAEAALAESTRLVPALESELQALAGLVAEADAELGRAEQLWQQETTRFQELDSRRAALAAHVELAQAELARLAPDFDPRAQSGLDADVQREVERVAAVEGDAARISEELGSLRERKRQAELWLAERSTALAKEESALLPLEQRRRELFDSIAKAGLLGNAAEAEAAQRTTHASGRELRSEARSRGEVLCDRLQRARGGESLAAELTQRFAAATDLAAVHVAAWKDVRTWLAWRLPSQIADVPDPLEALERLRDHLALLEERLGRQELDLRGASEDVARGIDVKLRRATAQVRRLNQHLDGISFGSVAGIRVELRRIERMDQILKAIREGQAQELLFQSSLPVEEALDEIFRRYGGGKAGGQRLLDYREYLELEVEVQRKAKTGFERVSPTRLSTGEAIGVGAALMMVVLTEWERDANLFRNRRSEGTLRFLFLDEANRLSQDNLGVLFDLCQRLELQLLIAAPEVARAGGNTTYRLVRQLNADGSEEVIVTGRRAARELDAESDERAGEQQEMPVSAEL